MKYQNQIWDAFCSRAALAAIGQAGQGQWKSDGVEEEGNNEQDDTQRLESLAGDFRVHLLILGYHGPCMRVHSEYSTRMSQRCMRRKE